MGKPVTRIYKCWSCFREFSTCKEVTKCDCGSTSVFVVGIPLAEYNEILRITGANDE